MTVGEFVTSIRRCGELADKISGPSGRMNCTGDGIAQRFKVTGTGLLRTVRIASPAGSAR
ncbi:MAG: hypothetical protein GEV03_26290 [Streptosporangiales bacterium]|nr:hypothetical protein [Streptosporangiales bacterium]